MTSKWALSWQGVRRKAHLTQKSIPHTVNPVALPASPAILRRSAGYERCSYPIRVGCPWLEMEMLDAGKCAQGATLPWWEYYRSDDRRSTVTSVGHSLSRNALRSMPFQARAGHLSADLRERFLQHRSSDAAGNMQSTLPDRLATELNRALGFAGERETRWIVS